MNINFTKMQALGNDFMLIDKTNAEFEIGYEQVANLANRRYGVGFDQMLLVEKSTVADFAYRIINADGSEVMQCGNGARCFALFVREKGLTSNNIISVETKNGLLSLQIFADNSVRVDMGAVNFETAQIPLSAPQAATYKIAGKEFGALSIGNPHCVIIVDDVAKTEVEKIAKSIWQSGIFTDGVNVGFMQIIGRSKVDLRVYERGVGETLACGSGACAAVIHGINLGLLDEKVKVRFKNGSVLVEYSAGKNVFLTGDAQFVYEGQIEI